jgi:hypothetical protein
MLTGGAGPTRLFVSGDQSGIDRIPSILIQKRIPQPMANSRHVLLSTGLLVILTFQLAGISWGQGKGPPVMQVDLKNGQQLLGLPIHWSRHEAVLIERSGRLDYMHQVEVSSHQLLSQTFHPWTPTEARNELQRELGSAFEILVQGQYVIAAPTGHAARWRDRLNAVLAGYIRYFEVRGWAIRQPDFPLIAIVFPDRPSFAAYCARENQTVAPNVIGSYFPKSNRCVMYERESSLGGNWAETESTIVHEAVHQMAYNTGGHERLFENPLWLVEGLASVFEQPAVYDLRTNRSTIESRMHSAKLAFIQPILRDSSALESRLRSLIESDQLFSSDTDLAYALSWAMLFYLSERMPSEFGELLRLQSERGFGHYSAGARAEDFRRAFKMDTVSLALQMQRLYQK